ncbi:RNA polymerase sigma-I factor [Planococcus sp. 11815]|uniref:RNA polymerase sigma-I factor n=1 Tax=Planococcus sp. 11815 TaxID=2939413 RepID=UPI003DA2F10B
MLLTALGGLFGYGAEMPAETLVKLAQQGDEEAEEQLISSHIPFVKKTAAQVCKRFIDDNQDEFSIALLAFHEAMRQYRPGHEASFLTFAHMVIRRRVIDHIRKESKRLEFSHDFTASPNEDHHNYIGDRASSALYSEQEQIAKRREEIVQFEEMLSEFGLSFQMIAKVSPAHEDARRNAIQIAQLVAETDEYKHFLLDKKKLPVKHIEELVQVSRKTIERNRKYIIAMSLLIMSELHYLKDYLKERLN